MTVVASGVCQMATASADDALLYCNPDYIHTLPCATRTKESACNTSPKKLTQMPCKMVSELILPTFAHQQNFSKSLEVDDRVSEYMCHAEVHEVRMRVKLRMGGTEICPCLRWLARQTERGWGSRDFALTSDTRGGVDGDICSLGCLLVYQTTRSSQRHTAPHRTISCREALRRAALYALVR